MSKKIIIASMAMILLLSIRANTQPNAWNYLNFESGGYVTEIIPVKYPTGSQPPSINQQVLYARTDVGGIYRSSNNGVSWEFASNYYKDIGKPGITESELCIQGVAIRHDETSNKQVLVVAWGNEETDASKYFNDFQSIWRSDNNGIIDYWYLAEIQSPGVWFKGNELPVKIGGPCITYDPNNIDNINPPGSNTSHMYMSGFGPSSGGNPGRTYLYKSIDDGQSWLKVTTFEQQVSGISGEGIICISIKEGNTDHIWIGTTHRIIYTTNAGVNWYSVSIPNVTKPFVKRIILRKEGSDITGSMVVWGDDEGSIGIGRLKSNNNWQYEPLNNQFYSGYTGEPSGIFSALAYVDELETMIIAGRYELPLRKTIDFGLSWIGENNPSPYNEVVFRYVSNGHNFPTHQQRTELHPDWGYMYDGQSCLTRNPNPGWGNHWYLSGGAGPRMTVDGTTNNSFEDSRWKYTVIGQAMTVNYDVTFNTVNYQGYPDGRKAIYMPLSDWTMGWTYEDRLNPSGSNMLIPDTISFDRQETKPGHLYDTYISNVTRILINPDNPNTSYCVGGSVYKYDVLDPQGYLENYRAGFFERIIDTDGDITYTRRYSDPMLREVDRAIMDAIMITEVPPHHRIVALVGRNQYQGPPTLPHTGVFVSTDGGQNWDQSSFDLPGDAGRLTQDEYINSLLPAFGDDITGTIGDIFGGHFTLTSAGGDLVYLWLESRGSEPYGGGLFISTDNGDSWRAGDNPGSHTGYFGPGSIKYIGGDELALVFRDFREPPNGPKGMYKGAINRSNNGSVTWSQFGDFARAEHVDYLDGKWAVYGMRTNDAYNQIYVSENNGDTWERIPKDGAKLPYFPKVHSLRIRPVPNDDELWIATRGQGVWIYDRLEKSDTESISMIMYLRYMFDTVSNFF